ncbi:hypothetical protein COV81_03105 [Candidatus Peregrinibacteria bacterium CG11_big_fil_rev_8_21_14_0_20_41_10]|nr:MAG: hypothetical protein COV81_03105 [Candidatus Peregrinibacteria bacterium CG11_big_fil_rev_8_21_14_0_20_41_10]PIZ74939.1 MAG: hypothetical protein COY06_03435 [Candidatus Peregrinibacteria bacterium CG_4_10_14_0_2_um_filter_41_8]PJC37946.1 MAG: hypothetical protein CO045_02800 [Candidatus Peregrinibacteria bacterium CG_4_9_14_0_2_um_filter_41_14]
MKFAILLSILTILDIIAVMSARYYVEKKRVGYLVLSLAGFATSGYLFYLLMGYSITSIINLLWVSVSTVIITLLGYLIFKEKVTIGQGIGMALVIIGMVILGV